MRPGVLVLGDVHIALSTRDDGDQRPSGAGSGGQFSPYGLVADRCTFVRQVHGSRVVVVDRSVGPIDLEADAIITAESEVPIGVLGADCSLIALTSEEGIIGVVHSGWRGLLAGVIGQSVEQMRTLGATTVRAVIGPTIGPECYAFSARDLEPLVERFGDELWVRRADGQHALDLVRGVTRALEMSGVEGPGRLAGCTACDPDLYSWRARGDLGRHALVVWREATPAERSA